MTFSYSSRRRADAPKGATIVVEKPHKYFAEAVKIDGHRFASKREGLRYSQLKLLEQVGEVRDLELQPRFPLFSCNLAGERVPVKIGNRQSCYVADFAYHDKAGRYHVEDVKGQDLAIGRLKRAIVKACYGIEVEVIR